MKTPIPFNRPKSTGPFRGIRGVVLVLAAILPGSLGAEEIGFIERFALAEDREEAIADLVPGTPDYYYYSALHAQQEGELDEVEGLLEAWEKRHGFDQRIREIRHRQALLTYPGSPEDTFAYLKRELGLRFDHERERLRESPDVPVRLDPSEISWEAYFRRGSGNRNLTHVSDRGLDRIIREDVVLTPVQRRELLQRLRFPDYERLVGLIAADLRSRESRGFGEFDIHRRLTTAQLEELLGLHPDLIENRDYVDARLLRLRPPEGDPRLLDGNRRGECLSDLWAFVKDLGSSFRSLQASVLYRRLEHARGEGRYPEGLFLEYLRLPRQVAYIDPAFLREQTRSGGVADLSGDFSATIGFGPVVSDEGLVRSYLEHFFRERETWDAFAPYVRQDYLERVFAETKLLHGIGDPEEWYALLSPGRVESLRERVEIDFDPSNPSEFDPGDAVDLRVSLKNVPELIVKVYRIHTLNYHRDKGDEIGTDLKLDGLIAHEESVMRFDEAPLLRHEEALSFEELADRRGVWVIELIGNGISSRALVRKGGLHYVSRTTPGGELVRVLTEANEPAENPAVWFGGERYGPNEDGLILLPFSREGGAKVVLSGSGISGVARIDLPEESYRLDAGVLLSQESLLPGEMATVAVRPRLTIGGERADLSLLENVRLRVRLTDQDGIETVSERTGLSLSDEGETTHEFRVPDRLRKVAVELSASLSLVSRTGEEQEFSVTEDFDVNGVAERAVTADVHLARGAGGYRVEVRGRTGEVLPDRAVRVSLRHRDFEREYFANLKTDEDGRVELGALDGIASVGARLESTGSAIPRDWRLAERRFETPSLVQAAVGEPVRIPVGDLANEPSRADVAVLGIRGGVIAEDLLDEVEMEPGHVVLTGLGEGDYLVHLRGENHTVRVRLVEEEGRSLGYALGRHRVVETGGHDPLSFLSVDAGGDMIRVQLAGVGEDARVHLLATRFVPRFDPFERLILPGVDGLAAFVRGRRVSHYVSGRDIGEEYRYILERQRAKKYPGNMLPRPGLLLNPWALRDTRTDTEEAKAGEDYEKSKSAMEGRRESEEDSRSQPAAPEREQAIASPALTFLGTPPVLLMDLEVSGDGVVEIPRSALKDRLLAHIVAVDADDVVTRSFAVDPPDGEVPIRDLTLEEALDPDKAFTQRRDVTLLEAEESLEIDDFRSARVEGYATIGEIYDVLQAIRPDDKLAEFAFVRDWPGREPAEKRELYSEHACHELHFFLSRKDPEFFEEVARPYLSHKKDKTFLDRYLLEEDLSAYLSPWAHDRLNLVERILLARRLGDEERGVAAGQIEDRFEMLPPDPMRDARHFQRALLGRRADGGFANLGVAADGFAEEAPFGGTPRESADRQRLMSRSGAGRSGGLVPRGAPASEMLDADPFARSRMSGKELREQAARKVLFEKLDQTREWAENNYHELPIEEQDGDLIPVNAFWVDYAEWDGESAFRSREFPAATSRFTEMMFVLSVMDLPFEADDALTDVEDQRLTLTASSPLLVFHEEVRETERSDEADGVLVSQNFYRADDRYRIVDGQRRDKFVTEEFLVGTVYGSQVVVTNPTSTPYSLELLVQIPEGAVPVSGADYTTARPVVVPAFSTHREEVEFYFPEASGSDGFPIYPVQVSRDEVVIATGDPFRFRVVNQLGDVDEKSWPYLSQDGDPDDVIDFLRTENLFRVDLGRIAWRMREDRAFFERALGVLEKRQVFDPVLWSYGIHHRIPSSAREYLRYREDFLSQCGQRLETELVSIDPVERLWYQHLEYSPLVHARAHRLGSEESILNDQFHQQYRSFLTGLSYRTDLTAEDRLAVTAYLLLQERIEEALSWRDTVDGTEVVSRLQLDYLDAYAAMYREDLGQARSLASAHREHPVARWRERFEAVLGQLDEIEGGEATGDDDNREDRLDRLSAADSDIDLSVENGRATLAYRNVSEARIHFYEMDLEFLFSSEPFVSGGTRQFSYIEPNLVQSIDLPEGANSLAIALPERYQSRNVLVEVVAGGERVSAPVYANQLRTAISDRYGRLEVTHVETGEALPKTYVKVFARTKDGSVRFYKDGYTDLRGKFDYASLSTNEIENVERFSILVLDEDHGSLVREVEPPRR